MLLPSAPRDLDTNRSQTVKEMHAEGPRVPDDTAEQRHSTHSQWAVMQARNRPGVGHCDLGLNFYRN